jgi:hypothetical protein
VGIEDVTMRKTLLACLGAVFGFASLAGVSPVAATAQEMVFESAVDPTKELAGPGSDGLFGVLDDDDLSDFGINPNGSISYIYLNEIAIGPITEFLSSGEGTLTFDALPFDLPAVVNDFDLEIVDAFTTSPLFDQKGVAPHELLFLGNGIYLFNYTATLCGAGETRESCDAFVEVDINGTGWLWQPGIDDPADLPSVNVTGYGANFVPFLEYVETVVPPNTTAISVASSNLIALTRDNTRGQAADQVIGGTLIALNVQF